MMCVWKQGVVVLVFLGFVHLRELSYADMHVDMHMCLYENNHTQLNNSKTVNTETHTDEEDRNDDQSSDRLITEIVLKL